jgi:hypothetical protein
MLLQMVLERKAAKRCELSTLLRGCSKGNANHLQGTPAGADFGALKSAISQRDVIFHRHLAMSMCFPSITAHKFPASAYG